MSEALKQIMAERDLSRAITALYLEVDESIVNDTRIKVDAAFQPVRDERDRLARAIVWALGYTDFRAREQGEGAYWWRTELRLRAKLTGEQIDAILAAMTPAGGGKNEK